MIIINYKPNSMQQKYYKQKQKENTDCKEFDEGVEHIILACPILAKKNT
jgi:hypothetical protein